MMKNKNLFNEYLEVERPDNKVQNKPNRKPKSKTKLKHKQQPKRKTKTKTKSKQKTFADYFGACIKNKTILKDTPPALKKELKKSYKKLLQRN